MNSIALAEKYTPELDEVFVQEAKSIDLEDKNVKFDGVDTVKILKVKVPDNSDYSRSSGFENGDVEATWEDWKLTQDRGREFNVDAVDNEETLDQTFGAVSGEFIRTKVVPETDLYRFAYLASVKGIGKATPAVYSTGDQAITALNEASAYLDEEQVPTEGRLLYITPTLKRLIDGMELYKSQKVLEGFSKIITVPGSRFLTKIVKNAQKKYVRATDGSYINFLIVHKSSAKAVSKHVKLRVFLADGDEGTGANRNQDMDAHKFQYRQVHDIFAYENKVAGIYLSAVPLISLTISAGSNGTVDKTSVSVPSGVQARIEDNKIIVGDTVITATASSGYKFKSWTGITNGVVSEAKTISCAFEAE